MTDKKKHIDLFEELILILSLKKRFNLESTENFIDSLDKSYVPDKEKTEKLLDELETYYKSKKPRRKYPFLLWLILLSSILIGIIVLFPKEEIESQPEKPTLNSIQTKKSKKDSIDKKEILYNETRQSDSLIIEETGNSRLILPAINNIDTVGWEPQKLRNQASLNDTTLEKVTIPVIAPKEDADTLISYVKKYCNLPEEYTFLFSNKSTQIKETYKDDLTVIASKIINCPNIGTINIKAFYTSKFILFSNKKNVTERVDNILKNLKRNGVTIKMLRKKQIEFVHIKKNEYNDSFEKVDILLEY